ncbi:DNA processing protein DprA [bacterium HR34]|nr:DNA processing protein DprA [bacterium HR34]
MENIIKIEKQSEYYPKKLLDLKDPPKCLWTVGNLELLKQTQDFPTLAVVGTRRYSEYGKIVVRKIVQELSSYFIIVSGMALGIDALSHKICIENNGKTIAVLGSGVDEESIYPRENIRLAKEILEKQGLIISELEPGTKATKFTFPKRNRIIAGLSDGVLVIEAREKSGTIITANFAKEIKRKVFAVPGSVFSVNSKGTNNLIKEGAILTSGAQDILNSFGIKSSYNKIIDNLSEKERTLLKFIENGCDIDELVEKLNLSVPEILKLITQLETKNLIDQVGDKYYPKI